MAQLIDCIILTSLFSTCRLYMGRQKPATGTQCGEVLLFFICTNTIGSSFHCTVITIPCLPTKMVKLLTTNNLSKFTRHFTEVRTFFWVYIIKVNMNTWDLGLMFRIFRYQDHVCKCVLLWNRLLFQGVI